MITYQKILAKSQPEKTLVEHTEDCFQKLANVFVWKADLIKKVAQYHNLNEDLLIKKLFLTVAFHDIGKANHDFQAKIRKEEHNKESHPLASVPLIYNVVKNEPLIETDDGNYYPEVLAIVSHHNKLYKNVYDGYDKMKINYADESYFRSFFEMVNKWAKKLHVPSWQDLSFHSSYTHNVNAYSIFLHETFLPVRSGDDFKYQSEKIRDIFILFKSVLHYADWLASSENHQYKYVQQESYCSITEKIKQKIPTFIDWQEFQKKSATTDKHIFVQIPTGQGKTEASLLWAINHNNNQKILFLLPTMVTTNKMWQRMLQFFGNDEIVGLSHGTAQYFLKQREQELEEEKLRQHYLYNRTFFKPVTVATVDQLIYSFFNWGYWVLTGIASYNAKIIIDEIHIYDAYTFGLLLKVIECIKPFNTQFAIMSASLPNILKEEIEKILPDYELIYDSAFDEKQRHVIEMYEGFIEEQISSIVVDYKRNKKVLIVCNTILKAREIYDALGEVNAKDKMLYHSQFILKDKKFKENFLEQIKDLEGGFVAVCTQIVEVSLDIDFDVLYTENAPVDALIQRLGRVNRKGEIKDRLPDSKFAKVVITYESEKSRKYVYKNLPRILELTFKELKEKAKDLNGNLKEKHFKEIVDKVYTRKNLGEQYFEEIKQAKKLISTLWQEFLKNIFTLSADEKILQEISPRKSDYITVEAVLQIHNQELNFEHLLEEKKYDILREYTLKVPLHIAKNKNFCIKKLSDSDIYLLGMSYNITEGLSLKPDDQNMM